MAKVRGNGVRYHFLLSFSTLAILSSPFLHESDYFIWAK